MKITKKALLQLYKKQSVREIGLVIGKSPTTISRYLKKFGIKARPFSTKGLQTTLGRKHTEETKQKLREQHLGKKLSPEHRAKVIKTLKFGLKGKDNPGWKGGKHLVSATVKKGSPKQWYVSVRRPEHPDARKGGYIFEHRLVMEQILERPLLKTEHIHHKNGIKNDNRPENLELVQTQHHFGKTKCPFCHKDFLIRT